MLKGVFRICGPARVFTSEAGAISAIREGRIQAGDIMVLAGVGPLGTGMEETYQVTSALKALPFGKHVALITDARFSGVSTGACVGHIGPEALAGGPLGKLREGDLIRLEIDRVQMTGRLDFIGENGVGDSTLAPQAKLLLRAALPIPRSRRIPNCPTTPASGRRCKTPAAGLGAAACTILIAFWSGWQFLTRALHPSRGIPWYEGRILGMALRAELSVIRVTSLYPFLL